MKRFMLFQLIVLAVITDSNSQDFSTIGEIYDFEVGDEFQYYSGEHTFAVGDSIIVTRRIILDKNIKIDTIIYNLKQDQYSLIYNPNALLILDTILLNDTLTLNIFNKDSIIFNQNNGDSVYFNPNFYNNRKITVKIDWEVNTLIERNFVDGCGQAKVKVLYMGLPHLDSLYYFKKGTEEWGTKILMDIHENSQENNIQIYPNPVKDKLRVTFKNRNSNFTEIYLINALGIYSPVCYKYCESNVIQIDCSNLSKGIYYIVFNLSGKIATRSLIKY